jgi:hypothetical protein
MLLVYCQHTDSRRGSIKNQSKLAGVPVRRPY